MQQQVSNWQPSSSNPHPQGTGQVLSERPCSFAGAVCFAGCRRGSKQRLCCKSGSGVCLQSAAAAEYVRLGEGVCLCARREGQPVKRRSAAEEWKAETADGKKG